MFGSTRLSDIAYGKLPEIVSTKLVPGSHVVIVHYAETDGYAVEKLLSVSPLANRTTVKVSWEHKNILINYSRSSEHNSYVFAVADVAIGKAIPITIDHTLAELFAMAKETDKNVYMTIAMNESIFSADCTIGDMIEGVLPDIKEVRFSNERKELAILFEEIDGIKIMRVMSPYHYHNTGRFEMKYCDQYIRIAYSPDEIKSFDVVASDYLDHRKCCLIRDIFGIKKIIVVPIAA